MTTDYLSTLYFRTVLVSTSPFVITQLNRNDLVRVMQNLLLIGVGGRCNSANGFLRSSCTCLPSTMDHGEKNDAAAVSFIT